VFRHPFDSLSLNASLDVSVFLDRKRWPSAL
jgi:hypothetical protein